MEPGLYDAVMTTVEDVRGVLMRFVTRLAYSAPLPDGQDLVEMSEAKAYERIA